MHSRCLFLLALLALLALPLLASTSTGAAQNGASLSVDPPSQTVEPTAGEFEVRIMVDDVTNEQGLGGYTLAIEYDNSVINAKAINDTGFIESTENAVICPASGIDNDVGRLAHLCLTIPVIPQPGPQTTEPQPLVRVTFEPVGEGTTTLDISETTIIDPNGDDIPATTMNGEVTVGAAAPSTAPATVQPASDRSGDSDGDGNTGLFVGVGVGGAAVLALAVGGLAYWQRRSARAGNEPR